MLREGDPAAMPLQRSVAVPYHTLLLAATVTAATLPPSHSDIARQKQMIMYWIAGTNRINTIRYFSPPSTSNCVCMYVCMRNPFETSLFSKNVVTELPVELLLPLDIY
jgi:hypothetical protein